MKRHLNMNEFISSSSFHHLHHRKQVCLCKQEILKQNRSISSIHVNQQLQKKSKHSLSYTSLDSYLKEFNLTEKDFLELRQALQKIFHYFQPKINCDHNQRLTSPYLQQQQWTNHDDQSLLPLYTNEYFIRNGLLNHNDGPEIYDDIFSSRNLYHPKSILRYEPCSPSFSSSMNISVPLTLLPNQKYLFTALTSNFASEKPRHSQSTMGLTLPKYHDDNEIETESMIIRRNKVQTWERENILQQKMSITQSFIEDNDQIDASKYHRSSIVRKPTINNDEKITKELIVKDNSSLQDGNDKSLKIKNTDDLFPMVKKLAPYIIIRNSFHLHINDKKNLQQTDDLKIASKKRSSIDRLHQSTLITAKQQSLLLSNGKQPINREQVHQRKSNHLLAEFESVLTSISK